MASFKFQVVERVEDIGNRAAAHKFGVEEICICRWRSQKASLKNMWKLSHPLILRHVLYLQKFS